jgi:hypothetical protein
VVSPAKVFDVFTITDNDSVVRGLVKWRFGDGDRVGASDINADFESESTTRKRTSD